jgi:hypothetical protein
MVFSGDLGSYRWFNLLESVLSDATILGLIWPLRPFKRGGATARCRG